MEYIERVELQFWQAGQVCPHLLFLLGRGPRKNACWGAPQTRRTSGHFVQKSLLSAARRYRSWALFRSSVRPSKQSMFPLTATTSRISAWALRYSA